MPVWALAGQGQLRVRDLLMECPNPAPIAPAPHPPCVGALCPPVGRVELCQPGPRSREANVSKH